LAYKPADFFIGVVEFFSVLVPGAVVAALVRPIMEPYIFGPAGLLPALATGSQEWIAYVIAAYLVGSMLFLIGGFLDSFLYDPLRKIAVPVERDGMYQQASNIKKRVLPEAAAGQVNTFQWARATLRLHAPKAVAEIERYEADSKFFRSLTIAVYALLMVEIGTRTAAGEGAGAVTRLIVTVALSLWPFATRLGARVFAIGALMLVGACIAMPIFARDWQAVALVTVLLLSIWRYSERRWKSTRAAYTYAILVYDQAPPAAGPTRRDDAGECHHRSRGTHQEIVSQALIPEAGAVATRTMNGRRRVLLVRAKKNPDQWIFPKGHVERGETPAEAAVRELREEAGYDGVVVAHIGSSEFPSGDEHVRVDYFHVAVPDDAQRLDGEAREQRWCTAVEAHGILTFDDAKELLAQVMQE
jgi:8-oxo-dGTP pyrophosphatase MutT (NUDIX family)